MIFPLQGVPIRHFELSPSASESHYSIVHLDPLVGPTGTAELGHGHRQVASNLKKVSGKMLILEVFVRMEV